MKRKFGDRRDGYLDKNIHGANNILIDLKPNRCDSSVYMNAKIDVTEFVKFMDKQKKEHKDLTYFHGISFVMAKILYSNPLMNRFIQNRKIYMHNDVSLGFTAKAQFDEESVEYITVLKIEKDDTLFDLSKKIYDKVSKIRENKNDGGANNIIDTVGFLPMPIRKTVIGLLKFLDRHGWLPKSLVDENLYYSSAILSNLGTFKVGAIYHNLTNFGTASSLITFGEIREENGRKYMELGATLDERIADGFYFCKTLKKIEYIFKTPELLLKPAGEKVSIPKDKI